MSTLKTAAVKHPSSTGTAITLDASDNVGIKTASPSNYYAKDLVIAAPDEGGITVVSDTTHSAYLLFADGTSGADQYRGQIFYDHNVDRLGIAANGSTRLLVDSDGLKFNGDTAAANALDDYEYGFFEPSLLGSVSNPTITWDTVVGQEGYYVKVGRMVHIQINFRTDTISGGSGNLYVGNLPFASPSVSGQGGMASFAVARAQDWAGEAPSSAYINEGTNYIVLEYRSSSTSGTNTSQVSDLGTTGNNNLLCISGTYYTTA